MSEIQERDSALQAIAVQVAEHLEGFTYVEPDDYWKHAGRIRHDDGRVISFHGYDFNRGRVEIHGGFPPHDCYPRPDQCAITVGATRKPQDIAKEISRRLLPRYSEEYKRVLASNERDRQAKAEQSAIVERLGEIIGRKPSEVSRIYLGDLSGFSGHIAVHSGGCVDFKIDAIPAEVAYRLASFIARDAKGRAKLTDTAAIDGMAEILNTTEDWRADTTNELADVIRLTGRRID